MMVPLFCQSVKDLPMGSLIPACLTAVSFNIKCAESAGEPVKLLPCDNFHFHQWNKIFVDRIWMDQK